MTAVGDLFEFPSSLEWLGRPPLRCETGLAGHVVVVLAWRLGCVHSREALAETARLVQDFVDRPVALIAVHVPTSAAERDQPRLLRALQSIAVPMTVAIDVEHELTRQCAWARLPALLLVDATARLRVHAFGVPNRIRLGDAIQLLLDEAGQAGRTTSTVHTPCALALPMRVGPTALAADGERLWISVAAQRRVIAVDRDGQVVQVVGSGVAGLDDGPASLAAFRQPVGLTIAGGELFVADAGAHTLRTIDRQSGDVVTVCGNGRRATDRVGGAYGTDQPLASPVALCPHDGALLIVQAGAHQVWQFDPATRVAMAWLGSGERGDRDGGEPQFAEPTGIVVDGDSAWLTDAGNGTLRSIDLAHLQVTTPPRALARPMAIVRHRDHLLVAASWQPAVLRCALDGNGCEPLFTAEHGLVEPVGLACDGDRLWIADVGADAVFVADLAASAPMLQRKEIKGLPALRPCTGNAASVLGPVQMAEHSDVTVRMRLPLEGPLRVANGELCRVDVADEAMPVLACSRHTSVPVADGCIEWVLPVGGAGQGALRIVLQCDAEADHHFSRQTWRYVLPVRVVANGPLSVQLGQRRSGSQFDDRADDYLRYRPSYPAAAIDAVLADLDVHRAADIGAGTGIGARLLADRGVAVCAIEPNAAMRQAAPAHALVTWIDGTAEATGLAAGTFDLVVVAQAFHWFDAPRAFAEFHRLLRPGGRLAILWNRRRRDDAFTRGYGEALAAIGGEPPAETFAFDAQSMAASGMFENVRTLVFRNEHRLSEEQLLGRARSMSTVPRSGPQHDHVMQLLRALREQHADTDGTVTMVYDTEVHLAERL